MLVAGRGSSSSSGASSSDARATATTPTIHSADLQRLPPAPAPEPSGQSLPEDGAALFALVCQVTPDKVLPRISPYGGKILQTSLSNESEERLQEALDAAGATSS